MFLLVFLHIVLRCSNTFAHDPLCLVNRFRLVRYTSFFFRLDNVSGAMFGDGPENENVIAIYVDGQKGTGWWYVAAMVRFVCFP